MIFQYHISSTLKQCSAALVALLLHLFMGICQGFSAVLIPQLESKDSCIKVTNVETSWIASIQVVSMPVAAFFVGILMDTFGRKRVIHLAFIPLIVGWIIISQSESVLMLYVGRFITGFAVGMDPAVIVYIAETNTPKYRATFLSLTGPTILVGTLLSYMLGHFLYWKDAALILACSSSVCCVCLFLIPESPVWLISKDKINAASKSLRWLRSTHETADTELEELHKAKLMLMEQKVEQLSLIQKIRVTKAWKPFLIMTCFFVLQQIAGITIIYYYAINFYQEFGTPLDSFVSSVIYVALSLCSSFIFTAVVEMLNRKTLLIISAGGVCLAYTMAAVYEFALEEVEEKPVFWFPLACMWISVAFALLGLGPLPWLMAGELFPTQVRGVMTSVLWTSADLYIFLVVKLYPLIVPIIRIYGVLMMFSASSFLTIIFSIFILPDTRGMTLMEIETLWMK